MKFPLSMLALAATAAASAPTIVFLFPDELGWGDVSYTDSTIVSPNAELADTGIKLESSYTAHWCAPSRAQVLTGRYWQQSGYAYQGASGTPGGDGAGADGGLSRQWKLLPEVLATSPANYKSYGFGKWHLGMHTQDYLPAARGFDEYFGYMDFGQDYRTHSINACGGVVYDFTLNGEPVRNQTMFLQEGDEFDGTNEEFFSTKIFTDRAIEVVEETPTDTPLFLYMAYQDVHGGGGGLVVPRKYWDMMRVCGEFP
jgi:arylsulfatase A-like enzyme